MLQMGVILTKYNGYIVSPDDANKFKTRTNEPMDPRLLLQLSAKK